ncbi:MAG: TlpA family protein disulfide reductase [Muribaculaceae bacterium]|nr:TlpA family protein disulfide reductase [Muribaculaceae bacterium]
MQAYTRHQPKLFRLIVLFVMTATSMCAYAAGVSDSLMTQTSFVLRGELSKSWRGKEIKFAVTDPIKNTGHVINHKDGRFEMTIPMRGYLQEMYLYIDGTVTIPVCSGDTINMTIGEDDMWLSASDHQRNLDLQLALAVHRKMRGRYMDINHTYNDFYRECKNKDRSQQRIDSLYTDVVRKTMAYHERHKTVVDTFISHHGTPRMEEYFRINGYFAPLHFLVFDDGLQYITTKGYISAAFPAIDYRRYTDDWMKYPGYQKFMRAYLQHEATRASEIFTVDATGDEFIHKSDVRRAISPSPLLADLSDAYLLCQMSRVMDPSLIAKYISPIHRRLTSDALKGEISKILPAIERLMPGKPLPRLALKDINGNNLTAEDFKGKYLYLDFWDFGCGPCIKEFGVMSTFTDHFSDIMDKLAIVTVCASNPSPKKLNDFINKHGMNECNTMLDKNQSDECYRNLAFPTYILVDPDGNIVEYNTDRPSDILKASRGSEKSLFERTLREQFTLSLGN